MAKLTKKQKQHHDQYDFSKAYTLAEGIDIVQKTATATFDEAVELAANLGVNPQKADQMVRGVVTLPHGTGKPPRILVICDANKEEEAKAAGADHIGLETYLQKIAQGWTDIDVIITTPQQMAKVGKLGKVLGPRGLMPNPKTGTVTMDIKQAVEDVKKGKISFKVDKAGTIHAGVGRVSFTAAQLLDNIVAFHAMLLKLKPNTTKGTYVKSLFIASTMGRGIQIDPNSLTA